MGVNRKVLTKYNKNKTYKILRVFIYFNSNITEADSKLMQEILPIIKLSSNELTHPFK